MTAPTLATHVIELDDTTLDAIHGGAKEEVLEFPGEKLSDRRAKMSNEHVVELTARSENLKTSSSTGL